MDKSNITCVKLIQDFAYQKLFIKISSFSPSIHDLLGACRSWNTVYYVNECHSARIIKLTSPNGNNNVIQILSNIDNIILSNVENVIVITVRSDFYRAVLARKLGLHAVVACSSVGRSVCHESVFD